MMDDLEKDIDERLERAIKEQRANPQKTLRDEFAMVALMGMNANPDLFEVVTTTSILDGDYFKKAAIQAYKQADAMLEARKTETNNCNGNGEG